MSQAEATNFSNDDVWALWAPLMLNKLFGEPTLRMTGEGGGYQTRIDFSLGCWKTHPSHDPGPPGVSVDPDCEKASKCNPRLDQTYFIRGQEFEFLIRINILSDEQTGVSLRGLLTMSRLLLIGVE